MFIINITVNTDITEAQYNEMSLRHTEWFKKHFQAGNFLMLGPYTDTDEHAGVIFSGVENRTVLQKILEEDCYYPNFAEYEVREFSPKLIAGNIVKYSD